MALKKAVKTEAKLRMAIIGPAGGGKTYTALRIAQTLAGDKPVALFDTEHGSAAKYASDFDFDSDNIAPPFHPDKFCMAIREAAAGGYGVVILDSLSHAWNGEGGMLDIVEQFARRMKNPNSFAAWKDATPIQNKLTEAIVGADIHVIVTMRSKVEYVLQDDGKGRQVPRKVGMAPIQREQYDYEFDVVMEMDAADNTGVITKSRCSALTGGVFSKPGDNVAKTLVTWLSGTPVQQPAAPAATNGNHTGNDKSPAFKRFMAEGTSTFNGEWDDARHWLIERYTSKKTPGNIRKSANDLYDDECTVLADALIAQRKFYQDEWKKAKQPAQEAA